MTIWRDDDIGSRTKVDVLAAVNDVFQRFKVPHTIAIMAAGMNRRPDLVELIRDRGMIVQLHCWDHDRALTVTEAQNDLPRAADMLAELFGKRPTILFPPWNKTDAKLDELAARLGMTVSTAKISLEQYIRCNGDVSEEVVNFHHWHVPEAIQLADALRIYTKGKPR